MKAFNTIGCENYLQPVINGQAVDMYIAGNDEKAKKGDFHSYFEI